MNILIANISAFAREKKEYSYKVKLANCGVDTVTACHTNESILKCLSQLEDVKRSGGIKKIIALVSNLTLEKKDERFGNLTAFEYVKKEATKAFESELDFVAVRTETEGNTERDLSVILSEICSNIEVEDVVYIDAAGGKRTISNIIQLLTNLLEYKGMKNPLALYSDIQNIPFITDTKEFDKMSDLANAFNEFMTTGKSRLLRKCVLLADVTQGYVKLVNAMCEFSDKINLGKVDDIEKTLLSLRDSLLECKKESSSKDLESVIINQFLPIIEQKFFGRSDYNKVDYIKLVQWCLDNDLLQQALTIFTEKIAISIFEKGVICYKGNVEQAKKEHKHNIKNKMLLASDWETAMFYSEIMSTKVLGGDKAKIEEFKECLNKCRESEKYSEINDVLRAVRLYDIKNSVAKSQTEKRLKKFCDTWNFTTNEALLNRICNDESFVKQLLGLASDVKKDNDKNTMADKFAFVEVLRKSRIMIKGDFVFNNSIVDIMYGYLYVKSVRNTVNHASSEENLNGEQKKILSEYGYDFSAYDFQTVKGNIQKALDAIVVPKDLKVEVAGEKKVPEFIKTEKPHIEIKVIGKIDLNKIK